MSNQYYKCTVTETYVCYVKVPKGSTPKEEVCMTDPYDFSLPTDSDETFEEVTKKEFKEKTDA